MTNLTKPNARELQKWRTQSDQAAAHLKNGVAKPKPGDDFVKIGFAFDDDRAGLRVITLEITLVEIARMTHDELALHIYDSVLQKAQKHTPPAGRA